MSLISPLHLSSCRASFDLLRGRYGKPSRSLAGQIPQTAVLLRRHEVAAEKIIAWIRIAIAAALAVALTSSTEIVEAATGLDFLRFEQSALFATMGFLVSGLAGLALANPARWRNGYAYVFVLADSVLVIAAVAAAVKGEALPGNAIPAVPIIWVAPLLLTVGAFRYHHRAQLLATVLFGCGLVLAAYGLSTQLVVASGSENAWAQLFAFHSNIMRFMMLMFGGFVIVFAVRRSQQLLDLAVREAARGANLARFLPAEIAQRVSADARELQRGRRQTVGILFVDIRGSTAIAETMPPERLSILLSAFRRRVTRAAVQHQGVIDKFIGDGALILFGVPEPGPQDAKNALATARRLIELVERWNVKRNRTPDIHIGIGVHYGEVFCGTIGDDTRLEFTVLGDAVNVAARLEQATKVFGLTILASEAVVLAADDHASWRRVGCEPLAGRNDPIGIFTSATNEIIGD